MNQLQSFMKKHTVVSCILIMFVSIAFTFVPMKELFMGAMDEQSAGYLAGVIEQTVVSVILILLLKKMNLLKQAGFTGKVKDWWVVLPIIPIAIIDASEVISGSRIIDYSQPMHIVLYVLLYMSTGLFEEVLCRGVVYTVLCEKWKTRRNGIYEAVLLSSILFGMGHLVHLFMKDESVITCIAQIIFATFIGVFFCGCKIRNKSIYPVTFLHGLVDITGDLGEIAVGEGIHSAYKSMPLAEAATSVIIMLPLLLYGLFVIRRRKLNETESVDCR